MEIIGNDTLKTKKQKTYQEKNHHSQNSQLEMSKTAISNRFNILSDTDSDDLEELKKIKRRDMTDQQTIRYDDLMKLQRKERARLRVAAFRAKQTGEERDSEKEKDKNRKSAKRKNQSPAEKDLEKENMRELMAVRRRSQTPEEKNLEREKQKEIMSAKRRDEKE